jgi:GAF domain-containing protein
MRDQAAGLTGVDLDDPRRVVAARRLESGPEGNAVLDRLCALAARLLSAGSAQVSLLTDMQVVVGGVGPGADAVEDGPTPREASLCTATARTGLPFVVPDARQDERVRDLPPVDRGVVGSYLGVPLTDGHGYVIGVFCVYDAGCREWSDDQVSLLQELAPRPSSSGSPPRTSATWPGSSSDSPWTPAASGAGTGTSPSGG